MNFLYISTPFINFKSTGDLKVSFRNKGKKEINRS